MITVKDQDRLLGRIIQLKTLMDMPEEKLKKAFGISKKECIDNRLNALEHIVADLRI